MESPKKVCGLAIQIWKPLKSVHHPKTYMEIGAFLGLVGHYWWFIKGFACIAHPLNGLFSGEGVNRKLEWVSLQEDALRAFDALKQACMSTPVLAFANFSKEFLLETNASKEGLGAVLSQKTGG